MIATYSVTPRINAVLSEKLPALFNGVVGLPSTCRVVADSDANRFSVDTGHMVREWNIADPVPTILRNGKVFIRSTEQPQLAVSSDVASALLDAFLGNSTDPTVHALRVSLGL